MKRTKIVFLTSSMQIGGQEQYIAQQIINLDKSQFDATLCCLKTSGPMANRVVAQGIELVSDFQRFKYDLFSLWRLIRFLRVRKPDILYIFDFRNVLFIGRLAAKIAGVPLVVISCQKMALHEKKGSYGRLDRLLMPLCDHVIAAAEAHRDSLIKNDKLSPYKVTVIHNGIDRGRIEQDTREQVRRNELGISESTRIIGTVARLSKVKSQDVLLEATRIVANSVPDVRLLIIGDGPERRTLEKKACDLRIQSIVNFQGFKKNVASIVKLFDVFVLPSVSELFSAATLEAMLLSKPVVVTEVGGMPEMVLSGITGYVVPAGNAEALAERILDLLRDPHHAESLGRAGRQRVLEHFTIEREVRQIESLFKKLLNKADEN